MLKSEESVEETRNHSVHHVLCNYKFLASKTQKSMLSRSSGEEGVLVYRSWVVFFLTANDWNHVFSLCVSTQENVWVLKTDIRAQLALVSCEIMFGLGTRIFWIFVKLGFYPWKDLCLFWCFLIFWKFGQLWGTHNLFFFL